MATIKIAIAGGTGHVGSKIGKVLVQKGYDVILGSRNPSCAKAKEAFARVQAKGQSVSITDDKEAARQARVIFLSFPSQKNVEEVRRQAAVFDGVDISGKIFIDLTNPVVYEPSFGNPLLAVGTSAGEEFSRLLEGRGAFVYKAFNTLGAQYFGEKDAMFGGHTVDMLYAGPHPQAEEGTDVGQPTQMSSTAAPSGSSGGTPARKGSRAAMVTHTKGPAAADAARLVERLITDCGFRPVWTGPIRYARNLESLAELWISMAYVSKARASKPFAFTVVDK